ncbi:hypothetical protein [Staphylococcus gallinarum]|uniref:hypothetical protein n=1 Tax=Staphylococcus gallinarum TaxID=1293 RepID=UPI000D1EAD58|nr:hypothetical protein [Staphylococcus gallinarum]PTK95467.1 hypothetical protein BUZ05_02925 [Staphylococcus gallinarum]PTK96386.1 hypothetical protein BUZ13_01160 [Staphylococcus gallinarum]
MAYEYEDAVISELEQMGVDYQSNGYFNMSIEVQEVYRKAKAFDEVKKYALSKYDEFEERKEFAENIDEWDYFNALNIANNAIINKCKQMENE